MRGMWIWILRNIVSHTVQVDSHGHVEEDGEQELVVDGHGDESALVEFGRSLPHHDAQTDPPQQEQELDWKS